MIERFETMGDVTRTHLSHRRATDLGTNDDRSPLSPLVGMDSCRACLSKVVMPKHSISINRAPVLTLWAAVVAERLGFHQDEALTLGRAVAGLNAQAKGRRLGIYKPHEDRPATIRKKEHTEEIWIAVCGRSVPAKNTCEGVRAVSGDKTIDPKSVQTYLKQKFGDDLDATRTAMTKLAKAFSAKELADEAYPLYERFRPAIPEGVKGWGAKGVLDFNLIVSLANRH